MIFLATMFTNIDSTDNNTSQLNIEHLHLPWQVLPLRPQQQCLQVGCQVKDPTDARLVEPKQVSY
jgi:hypothetical protein